MPVTTHKSLLFPITSMGLEIKTALLTVKLELSH